MKNNSSLAFKMISHLKIAFTCIKEAYTLKDKITIIKYYSKFPFFLYTYLTHKNYSRELSRNVMIKNEYGLFFCGNNLSSVFGFSSLCEPEVRGHMKLDEGVFIDIGSNGGMYSIPMGKMLKDNGKVISIEPEKNNFSILQKNVSLNNLNNVITINKACFSIKSVLTLHLDGIGTGGHSLVKKDVGERTSKIQADTLDNIISELGLKRVDLIKIDVEGAEADVLKGAAKTLKKYKPKIVLEAWDKKYLLKILKILNPLGYSGKKLDKVNYLFVLK